MKISQNSKNFEPAPEGTFKAVCVDSTLPKEIQTQYGIQTMFRLVFELDALRSDGTKYCAWSRNFSPSLHEKSNLRKFLKSWFGRDLLSDELADFDTERLVGRPAQILIQHDVRNGNTYANIIACLPDKSGDPLKASGKYVRVIDRPQKDSTYSRTPAQKPQQEVPKDEQWKLTKVHVGANIGALVCELTEEQITALHDRWIPAVEKNPSEEDKALIDALRKAIEEFDNIPY